MSNRNTDEKEIGRVPINEVNQHATEGHLRYVRVEGDDFVLYSCPLAKNKLSDAERARREKEKAKRAENFRKRLEENAKKRIVEEEARLKRMQEKAEAKRKKLEALKAERGSSQ